jgi:carbon monoxide dehydrogenase subunit G
VNISGSHVIAAEPALVYQLLQDPAILARCMPGCDELRELAPGEYEMRMKVAIAAVQGQFSGKVSLRDQQPPEGFRMVVEGSGKVGFVRGEGVVTLSPAEQGTTVGYRGEVRVGGLIAAVGQRLLDTTSRFLIRRFFECLAEQAQKKAGA